MNTLFPLSDHFDGKRFHNLNERDFTVKGLFSVLKWKLGSKPKVWPQEKIQDLATPLLFESFHGDELRVTFINHATLLIQWEGISILTDPVFSEKLGPLDLLNIKRYRNAGISLEMLPRIDYVFISHNHYDHLDLPSLKVLDYKDQPTYFTPLGVKSYLPSTIAARAIELDWWQVHTVGDLELTVVPARHWSKRTATDTNASLWSGVVFKARGRSVFFAGDTGYSEHFKLIENRTGTIDVALLPIGAYEPRWFMKESHMNPDDAVMAHLDLKPKLSIAIHFGTFRLTDEAIEDPIKDLQVALQKYGVNEHLFKVPKNGETFSIL